MRTRRSRWRRRAAAPRRPPPPSWVLPLPAGRTSRRRRRQTACTRSRLDQKLWYGTAGQLPTAGGFSTCPCSDASVQTNAPPHPVPTIPRPALSPLPNLTPVEKIRRDNRQSWGQPPILLRVLVHGGGLGDGGRQEVARLLPRWRRLHRRARRPLLRRQPRLPRVQAPLL